MSASQWSVCPFVNVNLFLFVVSWCDCCVSGCRFLSSELKWLLQMWEAAQHRVLDYSHHRLCACEIKGERMLKNHTKRDRILWVAYGWQIVFSGVVAHSVILFPHSCNNSDGVIPTCQGKDFTVGLSCTPLSSLHLESSAIWHRGMGSGSVSTGTRGTASVYHSRICTACICVELIYGWCCEFGLS